MYADEDTFHPSWKQKYRFPESAPYLQIRGENIARYVDLRNQSRIVAKENDAICSQEIKTHLVLRFFEVIRGYHEGNLDLSGRHKPRYERCITAWKSFIDSYTEYWQNAIAELDYMLLDRDTTETAYTPYVDDSASWVQFCKTWNIPSQTFDHERLLYNIDKMLACFIDHPDPIFQTRTLTTLPYDVLEIIFSCTPVAEGALLASTCRKLSGLGHRYRFQECSLAFHIPLAYWGGGFYGDVRRKIAGDDLKARLTELVNSKRTQLLSHAQIFHRDAQKSCRVKELVITDGWATPAPRFEELHPDLDGFYSELLSPAFYRPIYQAWSKALQGCQNVTFLDLKYLTLDITFIYVICGMEHLRTLNLYHCRMPRSAEMTIGPDSIASNSSLHILSITVARRPNRSDMWAFVSLFPRLRKLSVQSTFQPWIFVPLPSSSEIQKWSFWENLERLHLSNFNPHNWDDLADALLTTPPKLNLKHFKLCSNYWVPDSTIIRLLNSLRSPRLQILVLSGIQEGKADLFQNIANLYPDLRALSLDKRSSNRHNKLFFSVPWPHAIGEYARWMGSLSELRYFGWNRIGMQCWQVASPYTFLKFEEGFPEEVDSEEMGALARDQYEWSRHDFGWTVRTLAGYCHKLRYYSTSSGAIDAVISRSEEGKIELEYKPKHLEMKMMQGGPLDGRSSHYLNWEPRIPEDVLGQ